VAPEIEYISYKDLRDKKTKYGNKKQSFKGRVYHSRLEAGFAMWLDSLLREGRIREVIPQYKLYLIVNGYDITTHIVDFFVVLDNGKKVFVEAKGFRDKVWPIKKKLTEALYPGIPYLVNPTERQLFLR
jgi:hypothetical protein